MEVKRGGERSGKPPHADQYEPSERKREETGYFYQQFWFPLMDNAAVITGDVGKIRT